ncbi:MAG: hypothetical protein WA919_28460 [Coleofasciculaceae cyanobacterium]
MWLSYLEKILSFDLTSMWIFLKTAITAITASFFFGATTVGWGLRYQGKSQGRIDKSLTSVFCLLLTALCYLESLSDNMFSAVKLWFYIQDALAARVRERSSLASSPVSQCDRKASANPQQQIFVISQVFSFPNRFLLICYG